MSQVQYPSKLPLNKIVVTKNPRKKLLAAGMEELTASVKEKGVLQPVLVRPLPDGMFELVAGGRRYQAAMNAHGPNYEIPVLVREMTDAEMEENALIENVQREGMNPAEEAEAAAKILANCDGDRAEAARRMGWTTAVLEKRLALMNSCQEVRDALIEGTIKLGHAELLSGLAKAKQPLVLEGLLKTQPLPSVATLKQQLEAVANLLESAIFDKQDCTSCTHNSGNQQTLFGEAVSTGRCTNHDCWNTKTLAVLETRKESLKDEFPEVRIVRPGENFAVIKIVAEGVTGVGEEQATACRSCAKFGAAISAVPGKVGNVYPGLCFDAECNKARVEDNQKRILEEAEAAAKQQAESAGQGKAVEQEKQQQEKQQEKQEGGKQEKSKPTSVQDSTRVKEYRLKVWRKAMIDFLARNPEQNELVLIAFIMAGEGRHFSSTRLTRLYGTLMKREETLIGDPSKMFALLTEASDDAISRLRLALPMVAVDDIDESRLVGLMTTLQIDIADYWKLCEDYLNLLTKSEIEVIAEQIGLKEHVGKEFGKLMAGKKEEIVKRMLAVDGFDYARKVPTNMLYTKD